MAESTGLVRDLTEEKNGGVLIETVRQGEGDDCPRIGDKVFVHYTGKLEDGTVFDSSRDRNEPFTFTLGKKEVIKAWDCAVAHMRKGEIARITCAPDYAYGSSGQPPKIPPNATLIFEVELLEWKEPDLSPSQDGGILKRNIKQGQRVATPNDGATVTIKYTGQHEGRVFETREVTYTQGEGDEEGVIQGLEIAAKKMKLGEIDRLTIAPKYAYGETGCSQLGIPPNATLVYEVEMVNFEKAKDSWEMDVGEKIAQSKLLKDKGTKYFTKGNYSRALENYRKIVSMLEYETSGLKDDEAQERNQLLLAAHLNIAMCNLKVSSFCEAEQECDEALKIDPKNVKAIFRRGQSLLERCEFERALEDFNKVLELEPSNKAARNQITLCRQRQKEAYAREKQLYACMFQKMAKKGEAGDNLYKTMPDIGEWNNDMAKGMMPLQEERAAFEEPMDLERKEEAVQNGTDAQS